MTGCYGRACTIVEPGCVLGNARQFPSPVQFKGMTMENCGTNRILPNKLG